jgi:hypothetical protein
MIIFSNIKSSNMISTTSRFRTIRLTALGAWKTFFGFFVKAAPFRAHTRFSANGTGIMEIGARIFSDHF